MAWDNLITKYVISQARIVVMVKDGGAIVEQGDFEYREGRYAVSFSDDPQKPPRLEHTASFGTLDAPEPEAGEAVEGRIVIDGICEGERVEIRGDGWFGYDDHGNIEGRFEPDLPTILLDRLIHPAPDPDEPRLTTEEWLRRMDTVLPKTSVQYQRAARGRQYSDD